MPKPSGRSLEYQLLDSFVIKPLPSVFCSQGARHVHKLSMGRDDPSAYGRRSIYVSMQTEQDIAGLTSIVF
jgi:hypothetical protein